MNVVSHILFSTMLASGVQNNAADSNAINSASAARLSNIIRIERLAEGTAPVREAANLRMARLAWSITFRTDDQRPYNLVEMMTVRFPGRLPTGEVLSFSRGTWRMSDSMSVRPASDYGTMQEPVGPVESCPPTLPGYALRFETRTPFRSIRLGIWDSRRAARGTLVISFASNGPCGTQTGRTRPYHILLRSPIRWRLAAFEMNLDSPPSLLVVSDARVGEPITFALYDVQPRALDFGERRPGN